MHSLTTLGTLFFGSGRGMAEGLAMALMLVGIASLLGLALWIAHIVIIVKLKDANQFGKLHKWNKGLTVFHLLLTASCVLFGILQMSSSADAWKMIPVGLVFAIPGVLGFLKWRAANN